MINRIRDIRLMRGLTLAQVAQACSPPTTAQTVGRLETGTRTLSLEWMNRIAAALQVAPETLLASDGAPAPRVIAQLATRGVSALDDPREALLPASLAADSRWVVLAVAEHVGEHRTGDQIWLRRIDSDGPGLQSGALGREALIPLPGARFAFGRIVMFGGQDIQIMPTRAGIAPVTVHAPEWIALAELMVRKL